MKLFNVIRNFWKILTMDPIRFSKLIYDLESVELICENFCKMARVQETHSVVLRQLAVNQHGISDIQHRIVGEIDSIKDSSDDHDSPSGNKNPFLTYDIDDDIFH